VAGAIGATRLELVREWFSASPWSPRLAKVVLIAAVLVAGAIAYAPYRWTPTVVPATAPSDLFSAERAMDDLRAVASEPRSIGTPAHETTIETIQARLAELGVESEVVEGVVARTDFDQVFAGRLRNVIARIPGTDSTGAVALFSHFDSLPTSMNANDGGLGVATVLEAVRAIQAGPPLRNDIVLWFGDADETTAMNAPLLQAHRWFDDVRLGFAFEATGVNGPSVLTFAGQGNPDVAAPDLAIGENEGLSLSNAQLSADNGRWLREALDAIPHPVVALPLNDLAMGASPDLAMSMWETDVAGISFGQIGDSSGYHTRLDNPDRVSPASLQDSGDTSLALARHFGAFDFNDAPKASSLVAFNVLPGRVATYPVTWALPLALLALAVVGGALAVGRRRNQLTLPGVLAGIGLTLVSAIASIVVAVVATTALAPEVFFARNPYGSGWRMLLLGALAIATVAGVFLAAGRLLKTAPRRTGLAAGPLVVLAVLAMLTALGTPALSYVFLLPTLGGSVLLGWRVLRPVQAAQPWPAALALGVVGALVALVAVPLVYLLGGAAQIGSPMVAALIGLFTALLAGGVVPHLQHLTGKRAWAVPVALLVIAGLFAVGERATTGYSAERPRPDYIQYTLDADTGQATWLSAASDPDGWTEQFFTDGYTNGRAEFSPGYYFGQEFDVITAEAPAIEIPAPQLEVLDDTTSDGLRTLQLRIRSHRGAPMVHADLNLPGDLVAASVDGQALKVDEGAALRHFPIAAYNPGTQGIDVTITVRSTQAITGTLTDFSNGLPDLPGITVSERPTEYMPAPFDFRDPTVVHTEITL
jgi:hypothetical protein